MLLSQLSENDDRDPLVVLLARKLMDKGKEVWYSATLSGDRYDTPIESIETNGGWVTIEYGIRSERSGDIVKWDSHDVRGENLTLDQVGSEWWLKEI